MDQRALLPPPYTYPVGPRRELYRELRYAARWHTALADDVTQIRRSRDTVGLHGVRPQGGTDGEAELDVLIEVDVVDDVAELTMRLRRQVGERTEGGLGDPTIRAELLPVRIDETGACGVEEEAQGLDAVVPP